MEENKGKYLKIDQGCIGRITKETPGNIQGFITHGIQTCCIIILISKDKERISFIHFDIWSKADKIFGELDFVEKDCKAILFSNKFYNNKRFETASDSLGDNQSLVNKLVKYTKNNVACKDETGKSLTLSFSRESLDTIVENESALTQDRLKNLTEEELRRNTIKFLAPLHHFDLSLQYDGVNYIAEKIEYPIFSEYVSFVTKQMQEVMCNQEAKHKIEDVRNNLIKKITKDKEDKMIPYYLESKELEDIATSVILYVAKIQNEKKELTLFFIPSLTAEKIKLITRLKGKISKNVTKSGKDCLVLLPSSQLGEEQRKILGIDRIKVEKPSEEAIAILKDQIPFIAVEEDKKDDTQVLLTFSARDDEERFYNIGIVGETLKIQVAIPPQPIEIGKDRQK